MIREIWNFLTPPQRCTNAAVLVASIAAVIQGIDALRWVFIALILVSLSLTATGMVLLRRQVKRAELERAMEAAFGENRKAGT